MWPGEFSASNRSDQALSSSVTWGSVTHTSNSFPLASSHTEHDARCRNITVFLPGVLRVRGWGESVRYSGGGRGGNQKCQRACCLVFTKHLHYKVSCGFPATQFQFCHRIGKKLLLRSSKMVSLASKHPIKHGGLALQHWLEEKEYIGWPHPDWAGAEGSLLIPSSDSLLICPIHSPL